MKTFKAKTYTQSQIEELELSEMAFPYNDDNAKYIGIDHQYELTSKYFLERGVNLSTKLNNNADEIKNFLAYTRKKFYKYAYVHSKSSKNQIDYLIAKRGLKSFSNIYEYRHAILDAMFEVGCYILDNGDLTQLSGVNMEDFSALPIMTLRYEERDYPSDFYYTMQKLGLCYAGKYTFMANGIGDEW